CHGCGQPCDGDYCESCTCPQCGMTLFNEICDNCIYGAGMPIIRTACGGMCQPDNQNVDFSGSDRIQSLQYPDVNPPSPEISNEEIFQAKGDLMTSIQTFLERFYCIPFEEKPQILFQTWETFFAIQCSQPEDSNDLFQKLLEDFKELAEYDQSTGTDRPSFLNDNEDYPVQNKESPENSLEENIVSKTNQEPPQDSDIHQLIKECNIEVPDQQKQKIEDTIALDSKLLSINSINSQRLDKKEQEVKNVVEQPAGRRNQDEIECNMPAKDVCSIVFTTISNPLFKDNDNFDSNNDESLPDEDVPAEEFKIYLNPLFDNEKMNSDKLDPHCFNIADTIIKSIPLPIQVQDINYQQEEIDIVTEMDDVLPSSDENDDDLSLLEEADLFLVFDNSIPPGIENFADDPEGDIRFLEELLIDDSILSDEFSDANFEDNLLIS
nr:hypothetical protein [Tanacetum cinerariifolium]